MFIHITVHVSMFLLYFHFFNYVFAWNIFAFYSILMIFPFQKDHLQKPDGKNRKRQFGMINSRCFYGKLENSPSG